MQNVNCLFMRLIGRLTPLKQIALLLCITLFVVTLFMTINLVGDIKYIVWRRGWMLLTMLIVAFSASISTVLFQTITNNRILTPSLMGFEALFILLQTLLVFFYSEPAIFWLFDIIKFIIEAILLTVFALFLYQRLFSKLNYNLNLVLIVGIILGTLFHSASALLQRLLDPNEFAILQGRMFATFTRAAPGLVLFSLLIIILIGAVLWHKRYQFDVLLLGRHSAINLGLNYRQTVTTSLFLISVLVAVSTALVGPLSFLGLMVANIAYHVSASHKHKCLFPVAFLLAVIALIGGQLILEHAFNMAGSLSVVLEFVGGVFFIYLILKRF